MARVFADLVAGVSFLNNKLVSPVSVATREEIDFLGLDCLLDVSKFAFLKPAGMEAQRKKELSFT